VFPRVHPLIAGNDGVKFALNRHWTYRYSGSFRDLPGNCDFQPLLTMNNAYRFASGLCSVVLLALGFSRAAERLDPVASRKNVIPDGDLARFSWQCVPCDFA
jgi:hypothetical protein